MKVGHLRPGSKFPFNPFNSTFTNVLLSACSFSHNLMHISTLSRCSKRPSSPFKSEPPNSRKFSEKVSNISEADEMLVKELEECTSHRDIQKMEMLLQEFRQNNPNRHSTPVYKEALRCYLNSSNPRAAFEFFRATVTQGFKPTIDEVETIMHGLLRHSDVDTAQMLMDSIDQYRLKRRCATYNLWIGYYLRDQQPEKARSIFKEMETLGLRPNQSTFVEFLSYFIGRADYKAADKIREFMRNRNVPIDIRFYNGLLASVGKKLAFSEIENILQEMKSASILPNLYTYNMLICFYAEAGKLPKVQELLEEMRSRNITPTSQTFNRMLLSLSNTISPEQSKEVLQQMSRLGLTFNQYTYAALITNLLRKNKFPEAVEMIYELERKEIPLALESYGLILKICCELRIDPAVKLLMDQMRKFDVQPNNYIFSTLARFYLMRRNYARVDSLLLEMSRKWSIKPNPFVYATLLNHYCETLDFPRMRVMLERIKETNVEMNSVIYNIVMKSFYSYSRYQQGGHIARLKGVSMDLLTSNNVDHSTLDSHFEVEDDLAPMDIGKLKIQFEKMFNLPFKPTVHVYNEIMLSFFVRERFQEMFDCLNEMRRIDVIPNRTTYTFMMKAKIFQGEIDDARSLMQDMVKSGMKPSLLQCALFFHSHCRRLGTEEAENFLSDMEQLYHIRPNHVFYGSLIYAYVRKQEYSMVFKTFERMEKAGFVPDTETCNYVLIALMEINDFVEAHKFFEKMLLQGIRRNSHTYSYLAEGFLARNDIKGILSIFSDCIAPGNSIDAYPFNRVLTHLSMNGRFDEMDNVLKLMLEYCVQFSRESIQYVMQSFDRLSMNPDQLGLLSKIVRKMLVELVEEPLVQVDKWKNRYLEILKMYNLKDEIASFTEFLDTLPSLQKSWISLDPTVLESFSSQLISTNDPSPNPEEVVTEEFRIISSSSRGNQVGMCEEIVSSKVSPN